MRSSAKLRFRSTTEAPSDDAGTLSGNIARELNELMLIIRGCGALIRENLGESSPSRAHVRELLEATERATKLSARLHAYSRSQVRRPIARPPRRTKEFRPSTAVLGLVDND
jgi:hypothetical protein